MVETVVKTENTRSRMNKSMARAAISVKTTAAVSKPRTRPWDTASMPRPAATPATAMYSPTRMAREGDVRCR